MHKYQHQLIIMFICFISVHVADLELNLEKSSRPDLIFINKHGPAIYSSLFEGIFYFTIIIV